MKNLNLKSKLILLLLFPVIGLLFLSITISYDRALTYTKLEMLNKIVLLSTKTKTLVYSLQKERGFSNGYLGSKGLKFKDEVLNQEKETDQQQKELYNFLETIDIDYYGKDFKNTINTALEKLKNIKEIREKRFKLQIDQKDINNYYTKLIDIFIDSISYSSNFSNDITLTKELYAYSNLIYAIERTANERGIGTLAFTIKELSFPLRNRLHDLILEQSFYLKAFKKNLDKESLEYYKNIFKGKEIEESIRMRKVLLNSIKKKLIILQINKIIGYGGIIHYLNNYHHTKDSKYITIIKKQYEELQNLLKEYHSIEHLSKREHYLLNKIENEFSQYIKNINKKDTIIIENDALNNLTSSNFFIDDSIYWFNTMTRKISLLQEMDNYLIKQILKNTKEISKHAKVEMISYVVLCFFILLAVALIGRNISINIVNSVNNLLDGIDRFFKFVNKESKSIKLINIKSNDEIGTISKIINEKILISKKIIDEDIIERAKNLEIEVKKKTKDLEQKHKEHEILLDRFNNHAIATRTNIHGVITFATDKFCRLSGFTREELIGQNHNIVRHPEVPKEVYKDMWDTIQSGQTYIAELKNRRKDETDYWIKLIIVPEFNSHKNIIGYFSVKENIDDKIKIREFNSVLEEKIKNAIEESRRKDQMLSHQSKLATMGEMIGIIAHQWKQPLSSLSMKIQSIKYKKFLTEKDIDKKYIENFVNDNMHLIQFMTKTIDDFRDFFRHDKNKEDFSMLQCINKTLNIVKPQLDSARISITIDGDDFISNGLQSEFQQVIVNLISNAKDELISKQIENKEININTKLEENRGILTIKDNAGGIPKDILEKIFEPYFTTKETGKGTGIGLYISKTIVEDTMQGELFVENIDDGACFEIILPLA